MGTSKDYTGYRFEKLVAVRPTDVRNRSRHIMWECRCECGNTCLISPTDFKRRKSCGCIRTRTYPGVARELIRTFKNMCNRCYNPKHKSFKYYHSKDITVCDEWMNNPISFFSWSHTNGWMSGLVIDRINPDAPYIPSNCRYITKEENGSRVGGKHVGKTFRQWKIMERIAYTRNVIVECTQCGYKRSARQDLVVSNVLRQCLCTSGGV